VVGTCTRSCARVRVSRQSRACRAWQSRVSRWSRLATRPAGRHS